MGPLVIRTARWAQQSVERRSQGKAATTGPAALEQLIPTEGGHRRSSVTTAIGRTNNKGLFCDSPFYGLEGSGQTRALAPNRYLRSS